MRYVFLGCALLLIFCAACGFIQPGPDGPSHLENIAQATRGALPPPWGEMFVAVAWGIREVTGLLMKNRKLVKAAQA